MSEDLKNILQHLNTDVEQEKLLAYLNKKLSPAEAHQLEEQAQNDPFVNDALDGLIQIDNPHKIDLLVQQLHQDLHKKLSQKKSRKRSNITQMPWLYFTIILLLILAVLGYFVISKLLQ